MFTLKYYNAPQNSDAYGEKCVLKMFTIFVCRINFFFCTFQVLLDTFDTSDKDLKV